MASGESMNVRGPVRSARMESACAQRGVQCRDHQRLRGVGRSRLRRLERAHHSLLRQRHLRTDAPDLARPAGPLRKFTPLTTGASSPTVAVTSVKKYDRHERVH